MGNTRPKNWTEVRANLHKRVPRLIASAVSCFVVFTLIPLSRGVLLTHALVNGAIAVGVLTVGVGVLVGGLVYVMAKSQHPDGDAG